MMQVDGSLTTYGIDTKSTSLNWAGSDKSYLMFNGAKTLVQVSSWDAYNQGSDTNGSYKQYHIHGRVGTGFSPLAITWRVSAGTIQLNFMTVISLKLK